MSHGRTPASDPRLWAADPVLCGLIPADRF